MTANSNSVLLGINKEDVLNQTSKIRQCFMEKEHYLARDFLLKAGSHIN